MAGLVETQFLEALNGYLESSSRLAQQVVEREQQVNQFEIDIDMQVASVIARRQPVAGDMRSLLALMKSTTDLERIGDESKRIAKLTLKRPISTPTPEIRENLVKLKELVHANVRRALDSFARMDEPSALEVISIDDEVDDQYNTILGLGSDYISNESEKVDVFMNIIWVARALERIGDHATNIGENVVYAVSGRYIKHGKKI